MVTLANQQQQKKVWAAGGYKTKTLSIKERLTGRLFLADSGADVSVYPATELDKSATEGSCSLRAANGMGIKTYGTSTRHLEFPGITLAHKFVLADVTKPLLWADFFYALGLCVDFEGRRILSLTAAWFSPFQPPLMQQILRPSTTKSSRSPGSTAIYWRNSKMSSSHVSGPTAMPTG